ncbi:helicase [Nostoc linckia z18]|uniref:Helicase n=2 Tax=Nostoc linckia TaxID=92942 RepID=A0A9Q6ENR5_NOSLI|nr:ATP-binding domain-containing protein [Nostoc linckia]PHK42406.1 helicase [Nostoc linckia z15]PHK46914.1 helicase [Nostoc linckia z16]PHJ69176.1 helicase [Nostoc linckia z1]PHJ73327.1 helicase [Nostoc linckia z3]PHJ78674.1 helicase [Nostoc linckia z2]
MVNVIRGDVDNKPVSSRRLADYFESRHDIDGSLYLGYPIIGTPQGGYQIDALLLSREHGVVIFNIIEGIDTNTDIEKTQDESAIKVESRLIQHTTLVKKRKLMVPIHVVTFAPVLSNPPKTVAEDYPIITNEPALEEYLKSCKWEDNQYFESLNSVIQAITTIRKRRQRGYIQREDSRGAKLQKLEDSIANLDKNQAAAVLETVEGVQRIRGLAGSGKTIVLALKVAYLQAKHPDWNIAVTFNTRSLKNQFKHFINTFSIEHTNEEPDWERIKIIHAWGSPSMEGIYYEICKRHNIEFRDVNAARKISNVDGQEFDKVCEEALNKINTFEQYYDAILVDEAQDFSKHFLQLCYRILKHPKRLVYAYDELQSLNNKTMESPEVIFGKDIYGNPYVQLQNKSGTAKQDIILEKCYRNSRPLLTSAHALGFGIYRNGGLIQMFDDAGLWRDIGYEVEEGNLEDGKPVKLSRTSNTSPTFLESHSAIDDLIIFKSFNNSREQDEWLVNEIEKNIKEDELKYDDIMVIHSNPLTTKGEVGRSRALLFEKKINSNLAGVTNSRDEFFSEEAVTFTGIYRAKGNEAAMIYVINAHECFSGPELSKKRNILFTAMTRSKAWLRVLGYGEDMRGLVREFEEVRRRNFVLEFTYPTEEERRKMNVINRDISPKERERRIQNQRNLKDIVEDLDKGVIHKEDLSQELIEKLKSHLFSND